MVTFLKSLLTNKIWSSLYGRFSKKLLVAAMVVVLYVLLFRLELPKQCTAESLKATFFSYQDDSISATFDTISSAKQDTAYAIKKTDWSNAHRFQNITMVTRKQTPNYYQIFVTMFWFLVISVVFAYLYFEFKIEIARDYYKIGDKFNPAIEGKIIYDLSINILKYNLIGFFSLVILIFLTVILGFFVFDLFKNTLNDVAKYKENTVFLVSLLIVLRTSLLGSFILGLMTYMFRLTNASFDQAVRFNKRKHAAIFLLQLFIKFEKNDADLTKDNLDSIMKAFREWNVNVESAYTSNKHSTNGKGDPRTNELIIELLKSKHNPEHSEVQSNDNRQTNDKSEDKQKPE